jgi:hypothetical protein
MTNVSPRLAAGVLVLTLTAAGTGLRLTAATGLLGKATPETRSAALPLAGKLMVAGAATINGKKALPGTTIFSENRIAVAATVGNVATITLDRLGRVDLQPGTELVLRFAAGFIGGELLAGHAVVRNLAGVKVELHTPTGLATTDGQDPVATVASTQLEKVLTPQEMAAAALTLIQKSEEAAAATKRSLEQVRQQRDVVKTLCLNGKLNELNAVVRSMQNRQKSLQDAVKLNDKNQAQSEFDQIKRLQERTAQFQAEASQCVGEESNPPNQDPSIKIEEPTLSPDPPFPPGNPPGGGGGGFGGGGGGGGGGLGGLVGAAAAAGAGTAMAVSAKTDTNGCVR